MSRFIEATEDQLVERFVTVMKEWGIMDPNRDENALRNEIRLMLDFDDVGQCLWCKHAKGGRKCDAFDWIPSDIVCERHDHRKPFPGDHGIQFEMVDV